MTNYNEPELDPEFFEQLCRAAPDPFCGGTLRDRLHRNPPDARDAAGILRQLLNHAGDEIEDVLATAGNIVRWHGRDEISKALRQEHAHVLDRLDLLRDAVRKYENPLA